MNRDPPQLKAVLRISRIFLRPAVQKITLGVHPLQHQRLNPKEAMLPSSEPLTRTGHRQMANTLMPQSTFICSESPARGYEVAEIELSVSQGRTADSSRDSRYHAQRAHSQQSRIEFWVKTCQDNLVWHFHRIRSFEECHWRVLQSSVSDRPSTYPNSVRELHRVRADMIPEKSHVYQCLGTASVENHGLSLPFLQPFKVSQRPLVKFARIRLAPSIKNMHKPSKRNTLTWFYLDLLTCLLRPVRFTCRMIVSGLTNLYVRLA